MRENVHWALALFPPLSFCQAVREGKADEDEKEAENLQGRNFNSVNRGH